MKYDDGNRIAHQLQLLQTVVVPQLGRTLMLSPDVLIASRSLGVDNIDVCAYAFMAVSATPRCQRTTAWNS
jgi:hypothetical protein